MENACPHSWPAPLPILDARSGALLLPSRFSHLLNDRRFSITSMTSWSGTTLTRRVMT